MTSLQPCKIVHCSLPVPLCLWDRKWCLHYRALMLLLSLSCQVVGPDSVKVLRGQGMPISKSPSNRGDLKIRFKVDFPRSLSQTQAETVRRTLPRQ